MQKENKENFNKLTNKNLKQKNKKGPFIFAFIVILMYVYLYFYNKIVFKNSVKVALSILKHYIVIFLVIFILMFLVELYLKADFIAKHLQASKWKKYFYIVVAGLLSSGPIYLWYPLLASLKEKGLNNGLIATFLYNRAIKLPLLSVAIYYFGATYVLLLTIIMIMFSVLQGLIIEKYLDKV